MSKPDNPPDKNSDIARSIWLAGLGAYGRALDEAMNRYDKASKDTPKLFKELVKRGERLETSTRNKVLPKELTRPAYSLEERLRKVRNNLGLSNIAGRQDIEHLERRLETLEIKLDRLLKHFSITTDERD